VRSARLDELRAEANVGSQVRTPEPDRLCAVLDAAGHTNRRTEDSILVDVGPEQVGELAAANGIVLHGLTGTGGLEQAFFHLIERSDTTAHDTDVRS
jgi:ABC-2 type transport system ATP-binding protein